VPPARPAYRVELAPSAARDLRALPPNVRHRIRLKIDALAREPRPPGTKKLEGLESLYRMRVGAYRILYQIRDRVLLVLVVGVGNRREIYRR